MHSLTQQVRCRRVNCAFIFVKTPHPCVALRSINPSWNTTLCTSWGIVLLLRDCFPWSQLVQLISFGFGLQVAHHLLPLFLLLWALHHHCWSRILHKVTHIRHVSTLSSCVFRFLPLYPAFLTWCAELACWITKRGHPWWISLLVLRFLGVIEQRIGFALLCVSKCSCCLIFVNKAIFVFVSLDLDVRTDHMHYLLLV